MKRQILLLTDTKYTVNSAEYGEKIINPLESLDTLTYDLHIETITSLEDFCNISDFSVYDGIGITVYLKWFQNSSITEQIDKRIFGGFSAVKNLRIDKKYNGIISLVGWGLDAAHPKDFFKNKSSNGLFLIDRIYHPYFHINFSTQQEFNHSFLSFVSSVAQKERIEPGRMKIICQDFSSIGIIGSFFHNFQNKQLYAEKNNANTFQELDWLIAAIKTNDDNFDGKYKEDFTSRIVDFKNNIEKKEPSWTRDRFNSETKNLKDDLLKIVSSHSDTSSKTELMEFTNCGKVLYIEDVEEDQAKLVDIFKREAPNTEVMCAASWEDAEKLINKHNISYDKKSGDPYELVNSLINTVIVDQQLLDIDGFRQRYQGLEIIDKLRKIGYFNIVVLTHSERFIKNEISQTASKIMGWTKNDLNDETGQRLFVERVMDMAFEVVYKVHLLKPNNSDSFEKKVQRNTRIISELYFDFLQSSDAKKLDYPYLKKCYNEVYGNYFREENKKIIIHKDNLPSAQIRLNNTTDFIDKHIYNRLILIGYISIIIENTLNEDWVADINSFKENVSELILEKRIVFFGSKGKDSIHPNLCISGGWRDSRLINKIIDLKFSKSLIDDVEIGQGDFYWWEIFYIQKFIFEKEG